MIILLSSEIVTFKIFLSTRSNIVTENLKIISHSKVRKIVSKGPKYRFPLYISFDKCREAIASALSDLANRWCKRQGSRMVSLLLSINVLSFMHKILLFYHLNPNRPLGI